MSICNFISISGTVYSIEERALLPKSQNNTTTGSNSAQASDQAGQDFISAVSSISNMLVGVLFEYDTNDMGLKGIETNKGLLFLNGYLDPSGYLFSSPDRFDVNDVLPSQVPRLEQMADILDYDASFYDIDLNLPRQYWNLTFDTFTSLGKSRIFGKLTAGDLSFSNRTRSLILNFQNSVCPTQLDVVDTTNSLVSANLRLKNGISGSILLNKVADREFASIGTGPVVPRFPTQPLYGLSKNYDFYLFSRNHYGTLEGFTFEFIDQGYAMCLVDDGSGSGAKLARYYIDTTGSYYELYTYALFSPNVGIIETSTFTVKVTS
jgi:hypothetical protein